jgi:hypothetical protein
MGAYDAPYNEWALNKFGRIDFKTNDLDKLVYQKGARAVWEKSMLCSCIDPNTCQPDYTCPACHGKGYLFFDPEAIRCSVYGMSGQKDQIAIGLLDVGTCMMTTMSMDSVGFRDRITFLDFITPYSQVLTYDSTLTEGVRLKYQVEDITAIKTLATTIDSSKYVISADKQHLTFQPGVLGDGERFSVLAHIQPVYIVIDMPHELRGTFVKFGNAEEKWTLLPKQFLIKREDLIPLQRGQLV